VDRITSFVPNDEVTSAFLNEFQDRVYSLVRPAGSAEITGLTRISRAVLNQFAAAGSEVPTGGYKAIDQTGNGFDWRNAYVEGVIATIGGVNDRIGGSAEPFVNTYLRDAKRFTGYLGSGSSTSFNRSLNDYYIEADWDGASNNFNVYANPSDGELRVWNITGGDRGCIVFVHCMGKKP